jgi:hypothetical protein
MPTQHYITPSRWFPRSYGLFLLGCLLIPAGQNLAAQAVDTATAVPTNIVPTDTQAINADLTATNLTSPYTNGFQTVLPAVSQPYAAPSVGAIGTGQLASPIGGTSALTGAPPTAQQVPGAAGVWQAGNFVVHATLTDVMLYATGLESTPGNQASTFVNQVTPGVILALGSHWVLNYAPTFVTYSSEKFQNTINQAESLNGGTTYGDWNFGFGQSYAKASAPLVETGSQTESEIYGTTLSVGRQLGGDFSFQASAGQNYRATPGFDDVAGWTGSTAVYYTPLKQLSFNLSFTGGYNQVNVGSDMVFESLQAGLTFRPRSKLTLTLSGGAEDLQFIDPSAPSLLSPIFNASLSYQATKSTVVSLNAGETVTPTFYANEVVTTTSVAASIQQQLLNKLSMSLSGSYTSEPYTSIEPEALPQYYLGIPPRGTLATVRSDTFETFNARLTYLLSYRLTGSVFYTLSENSSGQAEFKYTSSQEGLSLSYIY